MKQSSLDEQEQMELDAQQNESEEDVNDYFRSYDDPNMSSNAPGPAGKCFSSHVNQMFQLLFCVILGQKDQFSPVVPMRLVGRLPWSPKVRQKDIDQFLEASRSKFIGFTLPEDHSSLAGLPEPVHEGFKILNRVSN